MVWEGYKVGVFFKGIYNEVLNSNEKLYGGSGDYIGNKFKII